MIGAARVLASLAVGLALAATAVQAAPRVASTHLCADQLLLLLAAPDQIVALSRFARDRNLSYMAADAAAYPTTQGLVEQIAPLRPDIVFVSAYAARPTARLLDRLGVRTVPLALAAGFDDMRANVRLVGREIDAEARAEALLDAFDRDLAAASAPRESSGAPPVAALYWAKGYTPASASLAAAASRRAGFVDLATALGLKGAARVSLEQLLRADPELVVKADRGAAALADLPLRHPALRHAFPSGRAIAVPDRLWICGAPFVADAVRMLDARRERLGE